MYAPYAPSQPYCALTVGAYVYVLTAAEWQAARTADQTDRMRVQHAGQTYWLTYAQYQDALQRGKAYKRAATRRARIASLTYGDSVEVMLEDGTQWQGSPAAYKVWYAGHARDMLAHYRERRTMENTHDDIQDPATPPSVMAADATDRITSAMPATIDPAQFKDQVYLIVHEAMTGLVDEARRRLALLAPPAPPTREGRVTAVSPQGYGATLIVREETSAQLVDTIAAMQGWLEAQGYTAPAAIPF